MVRLLTIDDGLNAAGGADGSDFGGGRPERFSDNTGVFITINGGTVITNDGSEANPGGMGGGQRGQMEGGQRPAGGRGEFPDGTKPEGEEAPPAL